MKKKVDHHSLRSVLESKSLHDLQQAALCVYDYNRPKKADKAQLVEYLAERIVAFPTKIANIFQPMDHEVSSAFFNACQWGSARLECYLSNHRKLLRQLPVVAVEKKSDDLMIYVPDEVRALMADKSVHRLCVDQANTNDLIDELGMAAVRRYGVVTIDELLAMAVKWIGAPNTPEMELSLKRVYAARSRTMFGDADYYCFGDSLVHLSVCGANMMSLMCLYPRFLARRNKYPRWQPASWDEFSDVLVDDFYDKSPAADRLARFLTEDLKVDEFSAEQMLSAYAESIRAGDGFEREDDLLYECMGCDGDLTDEQLIRLTSLVHDFADHTRLRWLNGHTPAEVGERYSLLPEDQVVYETDLEARELSFLPTLGKSLPELRHEILDDDYGEANDDDCSSETAEDEPGEAEPRKDEGCCKYLIDECLPQEPIRNGPRVGRNDPCPCGSGKKYKKCCGR